MHLAAPLPGDADTKGILEGTVGGALNVIRQAAKQGVKRVVLTSTILAVLDIDRTYEILYDSPDKPINETGKYNLHMHVNIAVECSDLDWNPATKEYLFEGEHHPVWVYSAAKTIAEQEVWKFAVGHPEIAHNR